jgi:argininosuccinate lyase
MRDRAYSHWSTASALALLISRKANLSWRTGHRIVGRLVREAVSNGITPLQVTEQMLKKAAEEIVGEELMLEISTEGMREVLDPGNFITTRCTQGSTNPEEVKRMAQDRVVSLEQEGQWIEEKEAHIRNAYNNLRRIAREIAQTS